MSGTFQRTNALRLPPNTGMELTGKSVTSFAGAKVAPPFACSSSPTLHSHVTFRKTSHDFGVMYLSTNLKFRPNNNRHHD